MKRERHGAPATSFDVHAASREMAAQVLGVSVRRLHELVAADVVPGPRRHGAYDLPPMLNAYWIHRAGVPMPRTFHDALRAFLQARGILDEYMRRHPEECAEIGTCADDAVACRHHGANCTVRRGSSVEPPG